MKYQKKSNDVTKAFYNTNEVNAEVLGRENRKDDPCASESYLCSTSYNETLFITTIIMQT